MDLILIVGVGLGFLMILGAGIALLAGAGSTNVDERLDQFVGGVSYEVDEKEAAREFERSIDMRERIDKAFIGRNWSDKIRARVSQADVKLKTYEYIVLQLAAAGVLALLAFLIFRGSIILMALPPVWVGSLFRAPCSIIWPRAACVALTISSVTR